MRSRLVSTVSGVAILGALAAGQSPTRLNPMISLLQAKKPVFGLYAPSPPRGNRAPGSEAPVPARTPAHLATEALA
ncbi:MAG: hypothetical protein H0W08_21165, partial [Acidobacteria bacterium]|nr:hypothetical protein [Acidobacteriota bacterium]